jgi:hypothetical protein
MKDENRRRSRRDPDSPGQQEPPAEPGYPEHPELAHRPGHLPGPAPSPDRGAAGAAREETVRDEHAAHGDHGPHTAHDRHDEHGSHGAHDKHAGHSVEMFRDRFWLTLALTIPTLIWSHELQAWFRYTAPVFPGSGYIPPVFGTVVYVYGGYVFLQGALQELRHRLPGMMTLIALAITRRLRLQPCRDARIRGDGALVGALDARHHHAARPLDRDAVDLPGAGRSQGAGAPAAQHRRAPVRRRDRRSPDRRSPRRRPRPRAPGRSGSSGRSRAVGRKRCERGDDHRRIPSSEEAAGHEGDSGNGQRRGLSARRDHGHRRQDGSCRHHAAGRAGADRRARAPRRSPTAPPSSSRSSP